jgi:hypothetical protein
MDMAKRSAKRDSSRNWLPVTVLRPFGPCPQEAHALEHSFLEVVRGDGREPELPPAETMAGPGASIIQGDEAFARVFEALATAEGDEAAKEAVGAALEEAARDPVRYVVVAGDRESEFGVVVLGRSIEYVAGPAGLPMTIRYVTEILSTFEPRTERVAVSIARTAAEQICFGLLVLCQRVVTVGTAIDAGLTAPPGMADEEGLFRMPVEVHLRPTPGIADGFAEMMADVLNSLDDHLRQGDSDEGFEMLRVGGPYLPGTMFSAPDRNGGGDTAQRLRTREILRRANLLGRSAVQVYEPMLVDGFGGDLDIEARGADAHSFDMADVILDPNGPRCAEALDLEGAGIRKAFFRLNPIDDLEGMTIVEIERTLSATAGDDGEFEVCLELAIPGAVGPIRQEAMATAIAEAVLLHARIDLSCLHLDLPECASRFRVRFAVPAVIAAALRPQIGYLHQSLDDLPAHLPPPRTEIVEVELRKPKARSAANPFPRLPRSIELDPDWIFEATENMNDSNVEVAGCEVLRRRGTKLVWDDLYDVPASTRDPFLLLRCWTEYGFPVPVVFSTVSGLAFGGDLDLFRTTMDRLRRVAPRRSVTPTGPMQIRALAERLFRNTSIAVAYRPHLLPDEDGGTISCNHPDPSRDPDLLAHLAIVGGAPESKGQEVAGYEHGCNPQARFHIAVSDDLRSTVGQPGPAAVVADFLVNSAERLIDENDNPFDGAMSDPGVLFLFAYAYIARCCPGSVSETDFQDATRLVGKIIGEHEALGIRPTPPPPDLAADILRHVAAATGAEGPAPLYLATAKIAAAFEAAVDEWDGFGMVP